MSAEHSMTTQQLERCVGRQRKQIRSCIWVMGLALLMIIAATHGKLQDTRLIAEQEKLIQASNDRIVSMDRQIKALEKEVDNLLYVQALNKVSRGVEVQRLRVDEMRMLAGTVYAEAQGEPELGKILMAKVVLNRLRWNPEKTMEQILHNPNQFATGTKYTDSDMDAVYKALAITGYDHLTGFNNPNTATNPEAKTHKILLTVGRHVFW